MSAPIRDNDLDATTRAAIERLESALWRAQTRFDPHFMGRVLAPDFFEIGRSGRLHSRETTLALTAGTLHATLPLPNFAARRLAPDVAQTSYISKRHQDGVCLRARRSSIWTRDDAGDWRLRFHQGRPTSA